MQQDAEIQNMTNVSELFKVAQLSCLNERHPVNQQLPQYYGAQIVTIIKKASQ
jgi:hypothetical protein